jgi:Ulp1 family protease
VNISNSHWALVMASIQEKKIEYYDSLHRNGDKHMEDVMKFLCQHYKIENEGAELDPREWKMGSAEVPKQNNGKVQGAGVQIIAS